MASVNKIILVGNLGADPEPNYLPAAMRYATFALQPPIVFATRRPATTKENTEWHRIVFFGKLAEIAGQYLKKGRQVYVEGRPRTSKWQARKATSATPPR